MKVKYLLLILYVLVLTSLIFVISTLSKYTSTTGPEVSFTIGDQLYFKYKRGNLLRNGKIIVGVETTYKDGEEDVPCITTMNVIPGDEIVYEFTISNYDEENDNNRNNVSGKFFSVANGLLSLPVKQSVYDVECVIKYRDISNENESNEYTILSSDKKLELPKYEDNGTKNIKKYQFQVSVHLGDQISGTDNSDYFGATLQLNLYFNAASI